MSRSSNRIASGETNLTRTDRLVSQLRGFCLAHNVTDGDIPPENSQMSQRGKAKACCKKICYLLDHKPKSVLHSKHRDDWTSLLHEWSSMLDEGIDPELKAEADIAANALLFIETEAPKAFKSPAAAAAAKPSSGERKRWRPSGVSCVDFGKKEYLEIADRQPHKVPHVIDPQTGRRALQSLQVNDVLSGRGASSSKFPGNEHFRHLVFDFKSRYHNAPRHTKCKIAVQLIAQVMVGQEPAGRFVEEIGESDYYVLDYERAIEKVSQALRDRKNNLQPANYVPPEQCPKPIAINGKSTSMPSAAANPKAAATAKPAPKVKAKIAKNTTPPSLPSPRVTKKRKATALERHDGATRVVQQKTQIALPASFGLPARG